MKKLILLTSLMFLTPLVARAQPANLAELVDLIISIINPLFILIISLLLIVFLWGLAQAIFALGGDEGVKRGKQLMTWGIIAIFLSVTFWGIVAILNNTLL